MPVSHMSLLAQTTKIVHLQGTWFSFPALRNNRWIARLFTVASHKLPVSKLLYYLWNRKITKKYLSWLLPAGELLPKKLLTQISAWEQRSSPLQFFGVIFTIVYFAGSCCSGWTPVVLRSWAGIACTEWEMSKAFLFHKGDDVRRY